MSCPEPSCVVDRYICNAIRPCTGYDGGDCCECTCISTDDHVCGESSDFACVDPSASCVSDDVDLTSTEEDGDASLTSDYTGTLSCFNGYFSDGYCDLGNNNEDCGAFARW